MTSPPTAETGTRARTRRAILDAAVTTLSHDPTASLGEIATAAGVGRTTVHRYFQERVDLLNAIGTLALERIEAATFRARPTEDSPPDVLRRLCQEYFELGDILMLVFNNPHQLDDPAWEEETVSDRAFVELVERGHADGSLDPELDADWVAQLMWANMYTAWEYARSSGKSKHDVLTMCLRSLLKAVRA